MATNEYDVLVNLQANANAYEEEIKKLKENFSQVSNTGAVEVTQQMWENLSKARKELTSIQSEMQKTAENAVKVRMGAGDNRVPKISSDLLTGLKTLKGAAIPSEATVDIKTLVQNLWKANAGPDPSTISENQQKILMVLQGLTAKKVTYNPGVEVKSPRYIRVGDDEAKRETMKTLASRHGYELKETSTKNWAGELESALSYDVTTNKPEAATRESKALDNIANYVKKNIIPNIGGKDASVADKKLLASLKNFSRGVSVQKREQQSAWSEKYPNFGEILSKVYENNDSEILEIAKETQSRVDREGKETDYSKVLRSAVDDRDADTYLRKVAEQMGVPTVRSNYHPQSREGKRLSLDEYAKNIVASEETLKAHGSSYTEDSVDNLIKKIIRFVYSGEIYEEMQNEGHSLNSWDPNSSDSDTKYTLNSLQQLSSYVRQNQTPTMEKFTEGSAKGKNFENNEIAFFFEDLYNILLDYASDSSSMNKTAPEVETRLKTMLVNIQKVLQAVAENPEEVLDQKNLTVLMSQMLTDVERVDSKGKTYIGYSRDAVRALRAKEGLNTYDKAGNDVTGLYPIESIPDSATGHLYQFPSMEEDYRKSDEKDEYGQTRLGKALTDTESKAVLMDKLFNQISNLSQEKKQQGFLTDKQQNTMEDAVQKVNLLLDFFVNTLSNQFLNWQTGESVLPDSDINTMNSSVSSFFEKAEKENWTNINGTYKPKNFITQEEKQQTIKSIKSESEGSSQTIEEIESNIQRLTEVTGANKDSLLRQSKSWNDDLKNFNLFISHLLSKNQESYTLDEIENKQSHYNQFVQDMDFATLLGEESEAYDFTPEDIMSISKKMNSDEYEYGMSKEDREVLNLYQQLEEKLKQAKAQQAKEQAQDQKQQKVDSLIPYVEKYKKADKVGKIAISKEIRKVLGDDTADYWKANKEELLNNFSQAPENSNIPVISTPATPVQEQVIETSSINQKTDIPIFEETDNQINSQIKTTSEEMSLENQQVDNLNENFNIHKTSVEGAIKVEQDKFEVSKALTEQLDKEKESLEALNEVFEKHSQIVDKSAVAESNIKNEINNQESISGKQEKELPEEKNAPPKIKSPSEPGTVTLQAVKIANYDDVGHVYTDKQGNQLKSLTTLAGYLKGTTNNPTFKEDSKVIRMAVAGLKEGEILTPNAVGMNTKDFSSMTRTLAAIEKGNLQHEVIDLMAKTGSKSVDELKNSDAMVRSKWGADGTQLKDGQTRLVKASEEYARVLQEKSEFLKKLGVENSEEELLSSTEAYIKALNEGGIALTKFSETPMAAKLSGNRGDYSFAFTPDQIGVDAEGNGVILDSKTGKTYGTESFQLAGQLYGILANKDNPEFKDLYEGLNLDEDFTTYIAKIDGVFTQLIKHMQLSMEEFYDLLADANDIAIGKQEPLSKYQLNSRMNRELQTGRIGGLNTSNNGEVQSQNLTLGAGTYVSYGENSKEENRIVRQYLSESNKKLSIQKKISSLESQITELSKDGTKTSQQQLVSLQNQLQAQQIALDAQEEYMQGQGLTRREIEINGIKRTTIGNAILSEKGTQKVSGKTEVSEAQYLADTEKSSQSARKAGTLEKSKAFENTLVKQKNYNALLLEAYELRLKGNEATAEESTRLNQVNSLLKDQRYSGLSTDIDDNGNLLNQQEDKQKLLDQLNQINLSEAERAAKEEKINNLFDEQIAKLQSLKVKNESTSNKDDASEKKKEYDNLFAKQKKYLELKEKEYELEQQLKNTTGDKAAETQRALQFVQASYNSLYREFTTGQVIREDPGSGAQIRATHEKDRENLVEKLRSIGGLSDQDIATQITKIDALYNEYLQKIFAINQKYAPNASVKTNTDSTQEINKYLKSLEQIGTLEREKARLQTKGQNLSGMQAIENRNLVSSYDRQISGIQNQYKLKQNADGTTTLNGIVLSEEEINRLEQERSAILDRNNAKLLQTQETVQKSKGFLERINENFKNSLQQISGFFMNIASFQTIERIFTNIVQKTSELDSKMVDLQIASGYTREEINSMMLDFNKLGKELGKSTTEIAEAANDWLRAGYEGTEASQLTEASMNLSTLGMINSSDATSYLISVMKGWKLEVSEIDDVVDKLVKTDMAAA